MELKTPISQLVESVLANLARLQGVKRYWLAFSGGIDSLVLLHVLSSQRHQFSHIDLQAVHVNHALNINADQWAARCRAICEQLKVGFMGIDVDATPRTGESPEARARTVRYEAIARLMREGDCLLTAHHQDDQVETLLLQLMRGSGPKGLAAMPEVSSFAAGLIVRPMINVRRDTIQAYAIMQQLKWVDDDSNRDIKFDRNFLRHEIIPKLLQRWPSLSQTVSRSARYCAEASEILENVARSALQNIQTSDEEGISIAALQHYSRAEQKNILRYWFQSRGLSTPSSVQLDQVIDQVIAAAIDATPKLTWDGNEVRRYRDTLFAQPVLRGLELEQPIRWDFSTPLPLGNLGTLHLIEGVGSGIARKYLLDDYLTVSFRQGGETIQPAGRKEKHSLKKLFQDAGIPPWIRERTPLIYCGDELMAVGDLFVSQKFHADAGEDSYIFQWKSQTGGNSP